MLFYFNFLGRENTHDSNGANVCYKNKGRIGCLNDLKSVQDWASKGKIIILKYLIVYVN